VSNPADAHAPEAATAPLRPKLLATSRSFLAPAADEREQAAPRMDMTEMKHGESPAPVNSYYTCPMHPEIKEAPPGNCPICGMALIQKSAVAEGAKP
jgi:Cu+-exporting ATPase